MLNSHDCQGYAQLHRYNSYFVANMQRRMLTCILNSHDCLEYSPLHRYNSQFGENKHCHMLELRRCVKVKVT